ncbi:MAG: hypothetical protein COA51_05370 [Idiomarina sp.]|nr:MAG: hypothetical protein COA51_05370 [Idiomarina sp.]
MGKGFTLLELLMTLIVASIIMFGAIPSMLQLSAQIQLKRAVTGVQSLLYLARSQAILEASQFYVVWAQDNQRWCVVVTRDNRCIQNQRCCESSNRISYIDSESFPSVRLADSKFNQRSYTRFDADFGLAEGHAGTLMFESLSDFSKDFGMLKLVLSPLGRSRICTSGSLSGVPVCD